MINNYVGTTLRDKRIQDTNRKNIAIPLGAGAVILASLVGNLLIGYSSDCHDLERVTLIGNTVASAETTFILDDLETNVFSYQLPIYLNSEKGVLYSFGKCPSP